MKHICRPRAAVIVTTASQQHNYHQQLSKKGARIHSFRSNNSRTATTISEAGSFKSTTATPGKRYYANPVNVALPGRTRFGVPPPPPSASPPFQVPDFGRSVPPDKDGFGTREVAAAQNPFDQFLNRVAQSLCHSGESDGIISLPTLYSQYRDHAGLSLDLVVPYEERPIGRRRADARDRGVSRSSSLSSSTRNENINDDQGQGDGIVLVVYALLKDDGTIQNVSYCCGFVVNAQSTTQGGQKDVGDVIVTCAHTLRDAHDAFRKTARQKTKEEEDEDTKTSTEKKPTSISFIITSTGKPYLIGEILSSMPKFDVMAMKLQSPQQSGPTIQRHPKLNTLPISPFPVHIGSPVLTHLFSDTDTNPVRIRRSVSRLPESVQRLRDEDVEEIEKPIPWLVDNIRGDTIDNENGIGSVATESCASRRWATGHMLGYRSYTGIEVEAGIHSSLPHILTSIIPFAGSSGGPIVDAETGAVVGMISGTRMDNRVEGERGWGCSAESIFEMFSLPGFTPTKK